MLGIRQVEGGQGLLSLPASPDLTGRPTFLHGGVISALLEMACYDALRIELQDEQPVRFKPINVSVDFLRGGLMIETFASARIVRIGGRVANATAEAWQDDRSNLIATARMHMLLDRR
jgi:acyl-coenzyme A thioesterase PaaI-like protein